MASTTTLAFTNVSLFANESRNRQTLSTAQAMLVHRFNEEFRAAGIEPQFLVADEEGTTLQLEVPADSAEDVRRTSEKVLSLLDMMSAKDSQSAQSPAAAPTDSQAPDGLAGEDLAAALHVLATMDGDSATHRQLARKALACDVYARNIDGLRSRLACISQESNSPAWRLVHDVLHVDASGAVKFILVVRVILLALAGVLVWLLCQTQMSSAAWWKAAALLPVALLGLAGGARPSVTQRIYRAVISARARPRSYRLKESLSVVLCCSIVLVSLGGGGLFAHRLMNGGYIPGRFYELGPLVFHDADDQSVLTSQVEASCLAYEDGLVKAGVSKGRAPDSGDHSVPQSVRIEHGLDKRPTITCEYLLESSDKQSYVAMLKGARGPGRLGGKPIVIPGDAGFARIWELVSDRQGKPDEQDKHTEPVAILPDPDKPVAILLNDVEFAAIASPLEQGKRSLTLWHYGGYLLRCVDRGRASPTALAQMTALLQSVRLKSEQGRQ